MAEIKHPGRPWRLLDDDAIHTQIRERHSQVSVVLLSGLLSVKRPFTPSSEALIYMRREVPVPRPALIVTFEPAMALFHPYGPE
jgi:hypothetical protein